MSPEEIKKIRDELGKISKWPESWDGHLFVSFKMKGDEQARTKQMDIDDNFIAKSPSRIAALLDEVEKLSNSAQFRRVEMQQKEIENLRAKLKVAVAALECYENVIQVGGMFVAKDALKKIREA